MNDGEVGKEVTVESMQSVSECTLKLPSEFGSRNTEHSTDHNDREKLPKEESTLRVL